MIGKKVLSFVFVIILVFTLPLLAAGAEKVLKVGLVAPLTGAGAPWGLCYQKTMQLQAEQYNAAEGLTVEGQKYKIEIMSEDDKYSPSEGVTVTNKLIFKEKVKFIMGPVGSAVVLATRPMIQTNEIVSVVSSYTPKALTPQNSFTFRTHPTMGETICPMFKWVMDNHPKVKKAALLGPNDESGWSILAEYVFNCKNLGFEVVAEEYFERNTLDYYPVLTRILKNQPDILMLDAGTGDLGLILKQARQMGFKGLTISSNPHDAAKLCKVSGQEGGEGHIHSGPFVVPGRIQKWHDDFVARWKEWDGTSILFVDCLDLVVGGIKNANSLDTKKIRSAMETMNYESRVYGPVKLGGMRRYGIAHQLLVPVPVSQVKNCTNVGLVLAAPLEPYPPPEAKKK
jgi:branched-chain amino acid transport system substrate-binding protein